jgi:sugar phosphate permease
MMLVLSQVSLTTSLWVIRGIMFLLGLMIAQIFVPSQAAAFARISPADTGRASTLFNTGRQVGSAVGVAILSTVLIGIGATHSVGGVVHPDLRAYHLAFATAAVFALAATGFSLTMHDSDAAETMVRRGHAKVREPRPTVAVPESVA